METQARSPAISLDVVSDVMCPWCWIGKRRLAQALDLVRAVPVEVRWRPYQLDPTIPPEGIDRKVYLERKFSSPERIEAIYARVRQAGDVEGLPFAFERIHRSPNTVDAHRLIRWAAGPGLQDAMVERLFALYFAEGADLTDPEVLIEAARTVGLDVEIVAELLASDADKDLVEQEIGAARAMGIDGVPCFLIANRYAVVGAQAPEIIAGAIRRAAIPASAEEQ
jgi:predicted DsbA family dithiol-disulfide isomerase